MLLALFVIANASVLEAPEADCLKQVFPVSAATLDALVPIAAQRTGFTVARAQSHGKPVWYADLGITWDAGGEVIRVAITPINEHTCAVCYLGQPKKKGDAHESPVRVWQHFMAWLSLLVFDAWTHS